MSQRRLEKVILEWVEERKEVSLEEENRRNEKNGLAQEEMR